MPRVTHRPTLFHGDSSITIGIGAIETSESPFRHFGKADFAIAIGIHPIEAAGMALASAIAVASMQAIKFRAAQPAIIVSIGSGPSLVAALHAGRATLGAAFIGRWRCSNGRIRPKFSQLFGRQAAAHIAFLGNHVAAPRTPALHPLGPRSIALRSRDYAIAVTIQLDGIRVDTINQAVTV